MTKKIIKSFRNIVLPHIAKELLRIDYEGMGQDDAKEFSEHFNEILDLAIKALEQEPCEDAVSRQAVLNEFYDMENLYERIKQLPPVTQKSGKWIKKEYWKPLPYDTEPLDYDNYDEKTHSEKVYHYYCSECGRDEGETKPTDNYCPNCGARMVEPQESEDKDASSD